jgi:predicted HTH transcriptional regulator
MFTRLGQTRGRIPPGRVTLTGFILFASDGIPDADVLRFQVSFGAFRCRPSTQQHMRFDTTLISELAKHFMRLPKYPG